MESCPCECKTVLRHRRVGCECDASVIGRVFSKIMGAANVYSVVGGAHKHKQLAQKRNDATHTENVSHASAHVRRVRLLLSE